MNPHASQFAERCAAALSSKLAWVDSEYSEVLSIIAGSYEAFEAMRSQRTARGPGSAMKANGIPPAYDDVAGYLKEIGHAMDPAAFMDHYTANGWKVGRGNPMKDWRSTCRNWKRNGWGLHGPKTGNRTDQASLGALQIELDKTREAIRSIVNPGGAAWPKTASQLTGDEILRVRELEKRRDELKKRISEFR